MEWVYDTGGREKYYKVLNVRDCATIKKQRSYYGEYRKAIFHIHTPASSDYTLLSEWKENEYKKRLTMN